MLQGHLWAGARLGELGVFTWRRRLQGDLQYLERSYKEEEEEPCTLRMIEQGGMVLK